MQSTAMHEVSPGARRRYIIRTKPQYPLLSPGLNPPPELLQALEIPFRDLHPAAERADPGGHILLFHQPDPAAGIAARAGDVRQVETAAREGVDRVGHGWVPPFAKIVAKLD